MANSQSLDRVDGGAALVAARDDIKSEAMTGPDVGILIMVLLSAAIVGTILLVGRGPRAPG